MSYQGSLQLEKYLDEVLPSAKLNIFNGLKKGDKVEIKYDFQNLDRAVAALKIRKGDWVPFVVTKVDSKKKIFLKPDGTSSRVEYFWSLEYKKFMMGGYPTRLHDIKK